MIPILILLIVLLLLACVKCKKEPFIDKITEVKGDKSSISRYTSRALMLFVIFFVLVVNFFALSLALQCNKDKNFITRTFIGFFAFMFSFIYIVFSYYMYRVKKGDACQMCSDNPFPFF